MLEAGRNEYAKRLAAFCSLKGLLSQIPAESTPEAIEPCWGPQRYFSSLDAVALYGMLFEFRPKRFVEVGSGYSTKFARRAIDDHSLQSRITRSIRHLAPTLIGFATLLSVDRWRNLILAHLMISAGDFLFVDSSHRTFSNSDVTVVFMDVLHGFEPELSCIFTIYSGHMIIFRRGLTNTIRNSICWTPIFSGLTF
jgi:hypothetical protein